MESLLALLTTSEELAVLEMQRIRAGVLQARTFMEELTSVFAEVQSSRAALSAMQRRPPVKSWRLARPGKVTRKPKIVSVLISPQVRLSGKIVRAVFESFRQQVRGRAGDVIIVGKVGRDLFEDEKLDLPYQYFDLPEGQAVANVSGELAKTLIAYDDVAIFHGRFINLVEQIPHTATLAQSPLLTDPQAKAVAKNNTPIRFLFEPSAEEVARFFDEQVASALLAQIINEGALALLGSRITALEGSQQLIASQLAAALRRSRLAERASAGREQADRLSGMALWYA